MLCFGAIFLPSRDQPTHPATCRTSFDKEAYPDWIYRWTMEPTCGMEGTMGHHISLSDEDEQKQVQALNIMLFS